LRFARSFGVDAFIVAGAACHAKHARMHPTKLPFFDTLCPESRVVLLAPTVPAFRPLCGFEAWRVHGGPDKVAETYSELDPGAVDGLLYDMSGNSFTSGVILALHISILLHVPLETAHRVPKCTAASAAALFVIA
jgi:hypothetical protein